MKLKPWAEMRAKNEGRGEGRLWTVVIFNDFSARGWKCSRFGPSQSFRILHVYPSVLMVASSQMAVVLKLSIIQAKLL